jgi:hypothetical protein
MGQCLDGVEACNRQSVALKHQAGGLQKVHLQDCYICAKEAGDEDQCKGILHTIGREEHKSIWRRINRAIDNPSLGAILFVQQIKEGKVVDILDLDGMNKEIQTVTEQWFDLSMSALITMSSLRSRLGFFSNTNFAVSLRAGDFHIPRDVNNVTATILG